MIIDYARRTAIVLGLFSIISAAFYIAEIAGQGR